MKKGKGKNGKVDMNIKGGSGNVIVSEGVGKRKIERVF